MAVAQLKMQQLHINFYTAHFDFTTAQTLKYTMFYGIVSIKTIRYGGKIFPLQDETPINMA